MTSFPCPMPSGGARIAEAMFEPDWMTTHMAEGGGRVIASSIAQPRWRAQFTSTPLDRAATAEWRAWLRAQKNGIETFYAVDPSRRLPFAYERGFGGLTRAGGGAFDGTTSAWSVDADGVMLTLSNLPAGFKLRDDDRIGFVWGVTKRALVAVEGAESAANVSGVWTGAISPPLPRVVPPGATVNLAAPECVMRITPGSVQGLGVRFGNRIPQVRFAAIEHLQV